MMDHLQLHTIVAVLLHITRQWSALQQLHSWLRYIAEQRLHVLLVLLQGARGCMCDALLH
jgi:hypothetical protein